MTNYTPAQLEAWAGLGPWCQPDGPEYGVMLDRVPSRLIHGFLGQPIFDKQPHDDWFEQEMANAALIAAAPDLARLVLEKDAEIARLKAAALDLVSLCHADVKMNGTTYQPMPYRSAFTKAVERMIELLNRDRQAMKETSDE